MGWVICKSFKLSTFPMQCVQQDSYLSCARGALARWKVARYTMIRYLVKSFRKAVPLRAFRLGQDILNLLTAAGW